ncbi:MAG: hypothetical protein GQE15_02885 [Archangiaceae bacterium]|nr:hypothetical protein [Archangiaceae bacterium]
MRTMVLMTSMVMTGCFGSVGSGRDATQTRDLGAFKKLSIQSGVQATVTTGARSVSITADDNLVDLVETVVENETLIVRVKPGLSVSTSRGLRATISNDVIEGVSASGGSVVTAPATAATTWKGEASGGSTLTLSGVSTTTATFTASGGSTLSVGGQATDTTITASGGSTVTSTGLVTTRLTVDFSGGSIGKLRATNSVAGTAAGGSTVTITGAQSVMVDASGGSTVTTN